MRVVVIQALLGLLIGAVAGLLLGFVQLASAEKISPSNNFGMMLVPTGWFRVGLLGGILMGLVGAVVGLITGAFGLGPYQGAAAGLFIWVLLKWRTLISDLRSFTSSVRRRYRRGRRVNTGAILQDIIGVSLVLDLPLIGAIVALWLRHLFAGRG